MRATKIKYLLQMSLYVYVLYFNCPFEGLHTMGRKYGGEEGKWEERRGTVQDSHGPLVTRMEEAAGRALCGQI